MPPIKSPLVSYLKPRTANRESKKSTQHPDRQHRIISFAVMSLKNNTDKSPLILVRGQVELKVPLALGTLQWGTTWVDDKIINRKGVLAESVCQGIVDVVSKKNVTLFDTAEGYGGGTSEKRCGRLLNDDYVLMTKFLPAPWRLFHSDLEAAVRESCRRLQVKSIPVYLLHSPVHPWRQIEYWVESCAICHKKGLIKSMGLSNWCV